MSSYETLSPPVVSVSDPLRMDKARNRSKSTTTVVSSSSCTSTGSRKIELNAARRPSDNLLANLLDSTETKVITESNRSNSEVIIENEVLAEYSPPERRFATKHTRPISNDSIATRTTEIFSSTSSDVNSRSSSIENEELDHSTDGKNHNTVTDAEGNDERSFDMSFDSSTVSQSTIVNNNNNGDAGSAANSPNPRRKFYFDNGNNSARAKSQMTITTMASTPTKLALNRKYSSPNVSSHPLASKLYDHSNSTTAILPTKLGLSPSQRYRMRRARGETSLRKSIKEKEKAYDDQNDDLELQEGDVDDSLIWNIPMASFSTSSFLSSSVDSKKSPVYRNYRQNNTVSSFGKDKNKSQSPFYAKPLPRKHTSTSELSTFEMPISPIPGIGESKSDFKFIEETTKNLSTLYLNSSNLISKNKLSQRQDSTDYLPLELKQASDQGMEDLLLVSQDKLNVMSPSRPVWLPPKDPEERKSHERLINNSVSIASFQQLHKQKEREQTEIRNETNRQKVVLLLNRGITRKSSLQSLKKIIWETPLNSKDRFTIYEQVLESDINFITRTYIEPFSQVMELLNTMDFPPVKEVEISNMIESGVKSKISGQGLTNEVASNLVLLLKLKAISKQGLLRGDELLFYHLLQDQTQEGHSQEYLAKIWSMTNLIQMTCFNDIVREKYDTRILNSRGVVAHYLLQSKDEQFKFEFNSACLNLSTLWNILERIDHNLFMWVLDTVVTQNSQCFNNDPIRKDTFANRTWEYYRSKKVVNNYKILISFTLNVLLNYHIGFDNLEKLSPVEDSKFCIPIPMTGILTEEEVNENFVKKWHYYYKKF